MELPRFFPNPKQSQVTLVAQDTAHGLDSPPLKAFQPSATAAAMKTIKNLFAVPPKSQTKGSHRSCLQCKNSFKPSEHEEVYCSINCSRIESWRAMNKAHVAKQRALGLLPYPDPDTPDAKRPSLAPSRFSSSEKFVIPRPSTTFPGRNEVCSRSLSTRDGPPSPRRVLRKRSKSTSSALTLCSLPPPPPPSLASGSPRRMSRRISQAPSQTSTVVADDPFYHPDPREHTAYSRLVLQNRSSVSLALPPRPRLPSSAAVPRPAPRMPFLVRKPHHPISSTARPSTIPGPLAISITREAGGAPPTPPPDTADPPVRLRAGFDRRATRPRSNSFGGFGSLAIHASAT